MGGGGEGVFVGGGGVGWESGGSILSNVVFGGGLFGMRGIGCFWLIRKDM